MIMLHLLSQDAKLLAGSTVRLCCIVKTAEWFWHRRLFYAIVDIYAEHLLV